MNSAAVRHFDLSLPHGITLACRGAGAGRTRALLLHGFPEAAFVWDEVMQRLAPRAACVAPNLRGYIGSSAPADVRDYRAKHLVGDVVAAIEALGASIRERQRGPFGELVTAEVPPGSMASLARLPISISVRSAFSRTCQRASPSSSL
jgi:hypothetical protein